VCWSARVGGAEVLAADLAVALRERGAEPGVVVVGADGPIRDRLEAASIPSTTLGLARGSHVLLHPRRLARAVADAGKDGAILQSDGYLAAALRAGGYRGRIVAVQHGAVLLRPWMPARRRILRELDQLSGVPALDALVVVSESSRRTALRHPHPRRMTTIHNGIDLRRFRVRPPEAQRGGLVVGFAGRLIEGKGAAILLHALARIHDESMSAEIAGEGPARGGLESLAHRLGIATRVRFRGLVGDMSAFWQGCDLAVVPSHPPHVESFGIVAIEAMASGLPVVAAGAGGVTDLVEDGRTGMLFPPEDGAAMAWQVERVLADQRLQLRLLDGGLRFARQRAWPRQLALLIAYYRLALRAHGAARLPAAS